MPDDSRTDQNKGLFLNLIMMLSASAMQQLGKLPNPLTQQVEVNTEGARMTIDLIEMLKDRTAGNLDADEQALLNDTLTSLQLNFVQATQKTGSASKPQTAADESAAPPTAASDATATPSPDHPASEQDTSAQDAHPSEPKSKFHKSYG